MFKAQGRKLPSILAVVLFVTLASLPLTHVLGQTATGNFSVAVSPTTVSIPQGSSAALNLYVTSLNGFDQSVSLTYSGPSDISASFNNNGPDQIATTADRTSSSTVTIFVDSTASTGTYPFSVIGASPSGIAHTAGLWLTVTPAGTAASTPALAPISTPDFLAQPSPDVMTLSPGFSQSTTITFASLNGFSSVLSLSTVWTAATPAGVTVDLPSTVTVPAGGSASALLTLTANGSPSTGTYTLLVTATNGVVTHTSEVEVTINGAPAVLAPVTPDFSITSTITQPSPTVIWLSPGLSQSATIDLSSLNGQGSTVSLSPYWNGAAPSGVTVNLPSPVTVAAGGTAASTLTLTANNMPSTGSFNLVITATNGVVSHSTEILVIVS